MSDAALSYKEIEDVAELTHYERICAVAMGQVIARHRSNHDYTVARLAEALGVWEAALSRWESAWPVDPVKPTLLRELEDLLHLDPGTIQRQTDAVVQGIQQVAGLVLEEDAGSAWGQALFALCGQNGVQAQARFWAAVVMRQET